jgi:signal transduction histidine kinase
MADPIAAGCGLHAALGVPVRSGERTVGVLALFSATAEEPDNPLIAVLLGIAAQIGQYVDRQRVERYATRLARSEEEYIALVGHELRTPLTSIAAYTELLRETDSEDSLGSVRPLLDVVERNTRLLLAIVENLLDLAALDSGHTMLELIPTDLAGIVREAVDAARPAADKQGLQLRTNIPIDAPLVADPERLRQAVDHLIDNAVRYSPEGGEVGVSLSQSDSALTLAVADTGIGIPENELELVTRRLRRGSRSIERKIRGTGLGLAIATTVLARHGGTLSLHAGREQGTTAIARLPLRPPPAARPPDHANDRVGRDGTTP